jgi:hypothetical protein
MWKKLIAGDKKAEGLEAVGEAMVDKAAVDGGR